MKTLSLSLSLCILALTAEPTSAQNTVYVDWVLGSDLPPNTGGPSDPWQTITHALD